MLASGPSLTPADVNRLRGRIRVVAVNDCWRLAPWADAVYAADRDWWAMHGADVVARFGGLRLSQINGNGQDPSAERKRAAERGLARTLGLWAPLSIKAAGLSLDPALLHQGSNSGYQAINAALHMARRPARVILLGFDCGLGAGGKRHWFGDHPGALNKDSPYATFRAAFGTLASHAREIGLEIINCSRETTLECFRRASLEEALP